jgi:alkaline phosphatase D
MLRLLPRILQENNVKFVLLTGDQIYSDYPGVFSLFTNPYLIRRVVPGKTSLLKCTAEEVRRVYDMRYRMFWSMPPILKMYANYPCYPAMDDHEILDDWGSLPEHSGPLYPDIRLGARRAYYDYQASRVLPATNKLPRSFHYHFSYGNIGVFVMDIRSERSAVVPNQLLSVAQLDDLRQYLRNNGDKRVLLIIASVPVVHLPEWLTELGHKITGPKVDFLDQWSQPKNIPARNAFLSLLHEHQQAHPKQQVAIVSGDVHIASAFSINWRHGNKPRLYQFTSSAISNLFQGWEADLSRVGPKFLTSIACPKTGLGRECSGEVGLLPAAKEAASQNPFSGLNLGLIEVQRYKDVSNLKFKLIGYHPKEERPVTYFESGWLG